MPPGQAGLSLPCPGATCTWQLARWGSVPRQLTRWIQKEFLFTKFFNLEDKGNSEQRRLWEAKRGQGWEKKEALRVTPLFTLPQDAAPHLDLGSFIFKFQTFLWLEKRDGGEEEGDTESHC